MSYSSITWKKTDNSQYVMIGEAKASARSDAHGTRGGSGLSSYDGSGGSESAVKLRDAMLADGRVNTDQRIVRAMRPRYMSSSARVSARKSSREYAILGRCWDAIRCVNAFGCLWMG